MSQTTKGCSCWSRGWGVLRRRGHHRGEPGIEGSLARVEWGWTASHMAGRAPSVVRGHPADTWVGPPRGPGSMAGPCFPRVRRTWQRSGMPPAANPPTSGQHRQWQPSISLQGQTPQRTTQQWRKKTHSQRREEVTPEERGFRSFKPALKKSRVFDPPTPTRERKGRVRMERKSQMGQRATWETRKHKM